MRFLNNRIPPLVVTENHSGTNNSLEELSQPGSFIRDHTRRYVSGLSGAYNNRLLLPAYP